MAQGSSKTSLGARPAATSQPQLSATPPVMNDNCKHHPHTPVTGIIALGLQQLA